MPDNSDYSKEFTEKEKKYHKLYMDIAFRIAEMSYAQRAKVGCLIVKDERIISMGWNGMPTGMPNECEEEVITSDHIEVITKKEVLHAEANALMKLAKYGSSANGATLYTTLAPCFECAKMIFQSGIKTLVYHTKYRDESPLKFLYTRPEMCVIHIND